MSKARTGNLMAILAAVVLIAAGLWYLQSRPSEDACSRWQVVVTRQAGLLASQHGGQPIAYYDDAAATYAEDRPADCGLPSPSDSERRL